MRAIAMRIADQRFARYLIASVGSLAVDMGSFLLLLETSLHAGTAAAIAYCLGMIANWVLLSRAVFLDETHERGAARSRQKAVFVATTLGGLGATTAIVWSAVELGVPAALAKIVAVGVSFVLNYLVRKHFVFTAGRNG